jgi:hypothetical protein
MGSCVRFTNGPHTIKAYHKTPTVLRIETTSRNVTKIRAVKAVTNRATKEVSIKRAQLARSIFDYPLFIDFARLANNRFSQRLATLWDRTLSRTALEKVTHPVRHKDKSCKGFNFFEPKDRIVLMTIAHPSSDVSGFRRKSLTKAIPGMTPHQASYYLKRLKLHELIKKEPRSHTYSLTYLGRRVATTFVHLEQLSILPLLAG